MLQVPPEMWPRPQAFDEYWQESLDKVHIDDTVRGYLWPIAVGRIELGVPARLRSAPDAVNLFVTTGFLPSGSATRWGCLGTRPKSAPVQPRDGRAGPGTT